MDKNAIKKYAVWAREELIKRVSTKAAEYGITKTDMVPANADSVNGRVLTKTEISQRTKLISAIRADGYEQVIEEVAYTWFNRFIALRFMEVNNRLPSRVRVFTNEDGEFKPQIITEALSIEISGLDIEKVIDLKKADKTEELYKYLLITQCNALNAVLPGMFQKIDDYTELLFPDNILREGSVVECLISDIPEDNWLDAVQIIGWLYQYYNSVPKDMVFANLKKNIKIQKKDIPAATQLFTPDWIVRYMVENSLGRLWIEGHPNDELKGKWTYYLDEAEQEASVKAELDKIRAEYQNIKPEDIKCIDPCMGSGHILVYMFDILMDIYTDYGYSPREAVASIIENNLYGLDIDERAAQLSYFAVMMKACAYDKRFLNRKDENGEPNIPQPHVYAIVESNSLDRSGIEEFINGDAKIKKNLESLITQMRDASEYGSMLSITGVDFSLLYERLEALKGDNNIFGEIALSQLGDLIKVGFVLAKKYDVVVTNPPYMGIRNMSGKLSDYLTKHYPTTKYDLFSVFIEKGMNMLSPKRFLAMITQNSWMFINSFKELRETVLNTTHISNVCHLGFGTFGADFGTTSFVMNNIPTKDYIATYIKLGDYRNIDDKQEQYHNKANYYYTAQAVFDSLPRKPFAYWIAENAIEAFIKHPALGDVSVPRQGMASSDNKRFVRLWSEVAIDKVGFGYGSAEAAKASNAKWFPYNNGGDFRKWYGNNLDLVNYQNDGAEVKAYAASLYGSYSRTIKSISQYFLPGGTWNAITSTSSLSVRYFGSGYVFSNAGMAVFSDNNRYPIEFIVAFLNSKVADLFLKYLSPTLNFNQGDIALLPIAQERVDEVTDIASNTIELSKKDWDSFETSWDFVRHPLAPSAKDKLEQESSQFRADRMEKLGRIAWHYEKWVQECDYRFAQLKANEEELNRIFIDIYGLQDELTPDVEDKDVTVRKADLQRDIRSFISYAVGCMFGRYSLDEDGLAYAGGQFDPSKYTSFPADRDNIIPICDDDYFEDDIIGRFIRFAETVFGKATLQENLKFIADALGGKGSPKEVIRNYFLNDFYADHLKIYQKRPIYWLFDSGKKNGFKALVYMHRYKEDTLARMRTDYVHEQQARYRTAIADLEHRVASAGTAEKVKLQKRLSTLRDQDVEIRAYEEKVHHLADQMIRIDLDDGVKKNYEIFGDVLAKIK